MSKFSTQLDRLTFSLAVIAGLALLYMMSLTVLDIVGRSLRLFTIESGVEQSELLMVVVAFFGLARCIQYEGNIVVDVATSHLSKRMNRLIDAFWHLAMAAVLAVLGDLVLRNGIALDGMGQRTELLGLSPALGHTVAAIGMFVAMLGATATAIGIIRNGGGAAGKGRP